MRLETDERRPAINGTPSKEFTGPGSLASESTASVPNPLAAAHRSTLALRVITTRSDGRPLTRLVVSTRAAERAVQRAAERGHPCVVELVRLVPTTGDTSGVGDD